MGFKRGDIIWARVQFPRKWWPGLVSGIHGHWVAVSFFDKKRNRRYFLETEVCSFQDNFKSLVKTLNESSNGLRLLDSALKLIETRVFSSLKCSCYFSPPRKDREITKTKKDFFQSDSLLGFVLEVAVSPFIRVSELVNAVTMTAQIHAFRRYVVAEKSDDSGLEFEPSNEDHPDCLSFIETEDAKPPSLHEMLVMLRCLASGTMCFGKHYLNTLKQNVMMFRSLAYRTSLNPISKSCPPGISSHPRYITGQPSYRDAENNCRDVLAPFKPYEVSSIKSMVSKRPYDYVIDAGSCSKLCKTVTFFCMTEASALRKKDKIAEDVCELNALISKPVFTDLSSNILGRPHAYLHTKRIKCEANRSKIRAFSVSKLVVMINNTTTGTRNGLPCPETTNQSLMEISDDDHTTSVETNADVRSSHMVKEKEKQPQLINSDVKFKQELGQQPALARDTGSRYLHMKFPKDFKIQARNCLPCPETTNQSLMEISNNDPTTSVETNADVRSSDMVKEKQPQLITSGVKFKQELEQQPALGRLTGSRYLHMKFPTDFKIPSEKDLVRKFSKFGKVDLFRTKVFTRLGSAQVVFLHHLDAAAAYQFAKRKKVLFGEAKVLFWLGLCEKNGRRTTLPKLRSCLKKSSMEQRRQEQMHPKRVKFLMVTDDRK